MMLHFFYVTDFEDFFSFAGPVPNSNLQDSSEMSPSKKKKFDTKPDAKNSIENKGKLQLFFRSSNYLLFIF